MYGYMGPIMHEIRWMVAENLKSGYQSKPLPVNVIYVLQIIKIKEVGTRRTNKKITTRNLKARKKEK